MMNVQVNTEYEFIYMVKQRHIVEQVEHRSVNYFTTLVEEFIGVLVSLAPSDVPN